MRINDDFRLIALGIGKVVGINKDSIHVKMNFELPFSLKKGKYSKPQQTTNRLNRSKRCY